GQRYKLTARVTGATVGKGTQADKVAKKSVNKRGFRELNYDLPLSSPLPKFFGLTQTQTGNVLLLRNNRTRA
ncbi:uncharacterized protein METZ01_LOCUS162064, partial [marine metagenome]